MRPLKSGAEAVRKKLSELTSESKSRGQSTRQWQEINRDVQRAVEQYEGAKKGTSSDET